jgi:hypothetical protein
VRHLVYGFPTQRSPFSQVLISSITIFRLDYDSRAISVQKEIQADPHGKVRGYRLRYLGIRGDTIMWFYSDDDSRLQERLVVAKLSDPDGAATRYLDVDWGLVGNYHACPPSRYDLCDVIFPADTRGFKV